MLIRVVGGRGGVAMPFFGEKNLHALQGTSCWNTRYVCLRIQLSISRNEILIFSCALTRQEAEKVMLTIKDFSLEILSPVLKSNA